MNPLHLSGCGVEIQASNNRSHAELLITDGRQENYIGERYIFQPRRIEYDSIIIEGRSGHISLQALHWLSRNNIPVFLMDFDGSVISSILPPTSTKPDLRIAQMQAANDPERKFTIAKAFVQSKIERSIQVLEWLGEKYEIGREVRMAKHESSRLGKASTVNQLRTVEGRTALRYWQAFSKVIPESLHFQGRMTTTHQNNATDPVNAALNYAYGFLKVECRMAINSVGLEPAVGFLHELSDTQTKESLVYDLEEPFRFLADLSVIEAFETNALNVSDFSFTRDDYKYRIDFDGRRRLLDLLRQTFNAGVTYKGRVLRWHVVIGEKTSELARYLNGRSSVIDFREPSPTLIRSDNSELREQIKALSSSEAKRIGIGKSELHYLRRKAMNGQSFRLYSRVREKIFPSSLES